MPSILEGVYTTRKGPHIIFIHGSSSSPEGNWFPYVSNKLNELNISHSIPQMPDPGHPDAVDWVERLSEEVGKYQDHQLILVGHSRGTRTIQLYLQQTELYFKQVFLIATWGNHPDNYQYTKTSGHPELWADDIDFSKVKDKAEKFVVVHSVNDKILPFFHAQNCAKSLDAKLVTTQGRGHLADARNGELVLQTLLRFQTDPSLGE